MNNYYLYNYLLENSRIDPIYLDTIKYELDERIYYYGQQFQYPNEIDSNVILFYRQTIKNILKRLFLLYKTNRFISIKYTRDLILSNAYFTVNTELRELGYDVCSPSWSFKDLNIFSDKKMAQASLYLYNKMKKATFYELLQQEMQKEFDDYRELSRTIYQKYNFKALFSPNDTTVFDRLAIDTFKEIHKPTFIFLHGLPGRYNKIDEGRSDYLIVWGEKIKEHYVKAGHNPERILVSGHPYYKKFGKKELRYSFENILILTTALSGSVGGDRGNILTYLYSIQNVLQTFGVKKVRFRPHPSENGYWYLKFLDTRFFQLDNENLTDSLMHSSLVIGPTSTVMLETIYYGIHYQIYEPQNKLNETINYPIVAPFDGTDDRLPVAYDERTLKLFLKEKNMIDQSFLDDYIQTPFDISFINKLL